MLTTWFSIYKYSKNEYQEAIYLILMAIALKIEQFSNLF